MGRNCTVVMLMLQISDKFVLNLKREAIDPIEVGGHGNT